MMKKLGLLVAIVTSIMSIPDVLAGNVNSYSYASGSVTTSAYTTLWASTPTSSSHLQICDTSGHILKIATGAAGSEVDVATVQLSGCVVVPIYISPGTRLSIRAIDATATTGFNTVAIL